MKRIAVLGGGVAGLAAAWELESSHPSSEVLLLEGSPRLGGLVETEHTRDGFLLEHGPDALLTRKPVTKQLLEGLDLSGDLLRSSDGPRTTFVYQRGRFVALPEGLMGMAPTALLPLLRSPLMSPLAKLRLAWEPWVRARQAEEDETIASFVGRRFGRGFLEGIIRPVLEGVYGEGATQLSAQALLPTLVQAEESHGSVSRAIAASRRDQHAPPGRGESPFVTPRSGMTSVVSAMAARLRASVHTSVRVERLARVKGGLALHCADGSRTRVDGVVLAVPARESARLLEPIDAELASALGEFPHTDFQLVNLGFQRAAVAHPLDGTGFVVGAAERRSIRACTWASQKWPMRAPQSSVLLRCFMHMPGASEAELVGAALSELRDMLGIEQPPVLVRTRMRAAALPRCTLGHAARVAWIRERCESLLHVQVAGGGLGTVGVPDCARTGVEAARALFAGARAAALS